MSEEADHWDAQKGKQLVKCPDVFIGSEASLFDGFNVSASVLISLYEQSLRSKQYAKIGLNAFSLSTRPRVRSLVKMFLFENSMI